MKTLLGVPFWYVTVFSSNSTMKCKTKTPPCLLAILSTQAHQQNHRLLLQSPNSQPDPLPMPVWISFKDLLHQIGIRNTDNFASQQVGTVSFQSCRRGIGFEIDRVFPLGMVILPLIGILWNPYDGYINP